MRNEQLFGDGVANNTVRNDDLAAPVAAQILSLSKLDGEDFSSSLREIVTGLGCINSVSPGQNRLYLRKKKLQALLEREGKTLFDAVKLRGRDAFLSANEMLVVVIKKHRIEKLNRYVKGVTPNAKWMRYQIRKWAKKQGLR